MDITQIIIRKRFETGPLAGIASVIFDNALAVHDVKIAHRSDGSLIAVMPKDGKGRDVVHPITPALRDVLETEIKVFFTPRN